MAEALAAFAIAANVVQFIDFTAKIISTGYRASKSKPTGNDWTETLTDDLLGVSAVLKAPIAKEKGHEITENERELVELAGKCAEVASELLSTLEALSLREEPVKSQGNKGTRLERRKPAWRDFRTALKTVWSEDKIIALEKRVDSFRQQLVLRILVSFRYVSLALTSPSFSFLCTNKIASPIGPLSCHSMVVQ
jgi:hypothetical protein